MLHFEDRNNLPLAVSTYYNSGEMSLLLSGFSKCFHNFVFLRFTWALKEVGVNKKYQHLVLILL